jgi:hypothetical protein
MDAPFEGDAPDGVSLPAQCQGAWRKMIVTRKKLVAISQAGPEQTRQRTRLVLRATVILAHALSIALIAETADDTVQLHLLDCIIRKGEDAFLWLERFVKYCIF